jgi:hypothetical protein
MPARDPLSPFLEPLERLDFPYCVTGSVAASVYGEPRLTADIDIVLFLKLQDIAALRQAFPGELYFVPPDETLRLALARDSRGMFNLIHHESQFKADIYVAGRDIRFMLAGTSIDLTFVEATVASPGLQAQWDRCRPQR